MELKNASSGESVAYVLLQRDITDSSGRLVVRVSGLFQQQEELCERCEPAAALLSGVKVNISNLALRKGALSSRSLVLMLVVMKPHHWDPPPHYGYAAVGDTGVIMVGKGLISGAFTQSGVSHGPAYTPEQLAMLFVPKLCPWLESLARVLGAASVQWRTDQGPSNVDQEMLIKLEFHGLPPNPLPDANDLLRLVADHIARHHDLDPYA